MRGRGSGLVVAMLMVAGGVWVSGGTVETATPAALAADQSETGEAEHLRGGSRVPNPHRDLIF